MRYAVLLIGLVFVGGCEPDTGHGAVASGMNVSTFVDSAYHAICYSRTQSYGNISCLPLDSTNTRVEVARR